MPAWWGYLPDLQFTCTLGTRQAVVPAQTYHTPSEVYICRTLVFHLRTDIMQEIQSINFNAAYLLALDNFSDN